MSQSKPPSGEADNHPPQPRIDDAVLGGATPPPVGGLEGAKKRLAAAAIEERIAALQEALQYGEEKRDDRRSHFPFTVGVTNQRWVSYVISLSLINDKFRL
jgi:hypothetical protein